MVCRGQLPLEKHPCWKEGIKKKASILRRLLERANIDTSKCSICHKQVEGRYRNIHHKDKDITNNNLNNLVVCCPKCHRKLDGLGKCVDYAKKHSISYHRAWYMLNIERCRANQRKYMKEYYPKNKDKINKKKRERRRILKKLKIEM